MSNNFFLLQSVVDQAFIGTRSVNTDAVSEAFQRQTLRNMDDSAITDLLIYSGFIPDLYGNDSCEETLYSKLVEVLVCEWAKRMGFTSHFIKQKASYEDVNIAINGKTVVCDTKSFRLGRSQAAPNVKDFLKLEDIRKWLSRYPAKLGGLITYPNTHEWSRGSDVYQYCSTKNAPTIMLPYKYLSVLLFSKNRYNTNDLQNLWDYERLFPSPLVKTMAGGNKDAYWRVINQEILRITGVSPDEFKRYLQLCDQIINACVSANLANMVHLRQSIIDRIKAEVESEDIETLREHLVLYMTDAETALINDLIMRIKSFRQ